ncbi:ATP-binding cassette domain-containing protein [Gulosibacter macacae]|uniref:ATP-binding cassette domain-containing protein n=1 Tax=Gulosibacter macacae TaxID=2488791 RepID=A0A3P3W124_9MICO|nr:ATP-binding cassette domain-containing protein [Gulosibacter macacae]RRJ88762.1 ATP-binding cassette domain-containing protein [Gulosibacter macacae]
MSDSGLLFTVRGLRRGGVAPLLDAGFDARAGETTVLLSYDGSGAALLRASLGIEGVDAGSSRIGSREFASRVPRSLSPRAVAVLDTQPIVIPTQTVAENLRCDKAIGAPSQAELLHSLGLETVVGQPVQQLSAELQQRVSLGRAVATGAPVIAAFSPFSRLAARASSMLEGILRVIADERRIAVVHATNDVAVAARAQHVIVVRRGEVTADLRGASEVQLASRAA